MHGALSKPPLPMASLLSNAHVAWKTPLVMATWCQVELATMTGESVHGFGNRYFDWRVGFAGGAQV